MGIKAAWYGLIGKENSNSETPISKKPAGSHNFTDEDRLFSEQLRQMRQEAKRIEMEMQLMRQKKQLQDLKDEMQEEYDDYEEESDGNLNEITSLLAPILMNIKGGANSSQAQTVSNLTPPSTAPPQNPQEIRTFSDEEIRLMLKEQPKIKLLIAKKMDKAELKEKIREKMPVTDADFEKAHQILLTEF